MLQPVPRRHIGRKKGGKPRQRRRQGEEFGGVHARLIDKIRARNQRYFEGAPRTANPCTSGRIGTDICAATLSAPGVFRVHRLCLIFPVLFLAAAVATLVDAADEPEVRTVAFHSAALGAELHYLAWLPAGYAATPDARYPVIYLLHGRGDRMDAWRAALPVLAELVASGAVPPVIAILPDAPSSRRAGYYIDSQFTGNHALAPGAAVETALTRDLVAHVEATFHTRTGREARIVAGYSMGGYGALRFALVHPELFSAALVLSPAVYRPLPPLDSSTREFGAFGRGAEPFEPAIYEARNYEAAIPPFEAKQLPLSFFIAVGDDEHAHTSPVDWTHDLDLEAHTFYNRIRRAKNVTAELRVLNGTHNWDTWLPAFREGIRHLLSLAQSPQPGAQR
ncbi:MAG: hypothetical protein C0518_05810 [Opitutus sp.]|nr:hypothetical protein [Opitutus sp.]